jgi:hypothetical protein
MGGRGKISTLFLLCALAAALVVGCGGGGDDSGGNSTAALTKAEFIELGDQICHQGEIARKKSLQAALRQVGKEGGQLTAATEQKLVETADLPPIATMIQELSELEAPPGATGAFIGELEETLSKLEADPTEALKSIETDPFRQAGHAAKRAGFEYCSRL